jgi:predicted RNA-binding Zn ribbon-like protein
MKMERSIKTLSLDGGCLSFNFLNTVYSRKDDILYDYLKSYDDLLEWCKKANAFRDQRIKKLHQYAAQDPKTASKILLRIVKAREAMFDVFSNLHHHQHMDAESMNRFNKEMSQALMHLQFIIKEDDMAITWPSVVSLEEPLWLIMKSAFDVWTSEDPLRIKECPGCGYIFLDKTKNNGRRWCSMKTCGSNDKSLRYYYKNKD